MSQNTQIIPQQPILSIVIPTKDRYEYLTLCLETLIHIKNKYPEIEIVVQDNTENNAEIIPFLIEYQEKIKYYHISKKMSVVDNCNYAVSNSSGQYVCMLGDDDSVTTPIIDVCHWMKENGIESCLGRICRFNWPDMVYTVHKLKNLTIPSNNKNTGLKDLYKIREKILQIGGTTMLSLPKVYHAIVSRNALDRLNELCGSYFPGPSPDMANAIGLTFVLKNHVIIDTPIVVSGFSYKSTGGAGTRRAHIGRIEDISHLPNETKKIWDKRIPRYWTAETIYAESIIEALNKCDSKEVSKYSFSALYGAFAMYHRNLIPLLNGFVNINNIIPVSFHYTRVLFKRSVNYFRNIAETKLHMSSNITFDNVKTLSEAVCVVDEWAKKNNLECSHRKLKID